MTQQEASDRMWAVEAARYLRVSRSTLAKWRMNGMGPAFHRCGLRLVYYYKHEIDAWLADCDRQKARRALSAMLAEPRVAEIAEILAAGLMRLESRKSSPEPAVVGESSLDFSPDRSGHPNPENGRKTDG